MDRLVSRDMRQVAGALKAVYGTEAVFRLGDLLSDLMHWSDAEGMDFRFALGSAFEQYCWEISDERSKQAIYDEMVRDDPDGDQQTLLTMGAAGPMS